MYIKRRRNVIFKIVDKNDKRHVALFLTIKMALLLTIKIKDSNFIFNVRMIQDGRSKGERKRVQNYNDHNLLNFCLLLFKLLLWLLLKDLLLDKPLEGDG